MWKKKFWKRAFERAFKTFGQTAATVMELSGVMYASLSDQQWDTLQKTLNLDWGTYFLSVAVISLVNAVHSIFTSIGSLPIGPDDHNPSIVH